MHRFILLIIATGALTLSSLGWSAEASACSFAAEYFMTIPAPFEVVGPDTQVGYAARHPNESFAQSPRLTLRNSTGMEIPLGEMTTYSEGPTKQLAMALPAQPLPPGTYTVEAEPNSDLPSGTMAGRTWSFTVETDAAPETLQAPDIAWAQVAFDVEALFSPSCGGERGMYAHQVLVTQPPELTDRAQWYQVRVFMAGNENIMRALLFDDDMIKAGETSASITLWTPKAGTCVSVTGIDAHGMETAEANTCTPTQSGSHPGGTLDGSFDTTSEAITWQSPAFSGDLSAPDDDAAAGCTAAPTNPGLMWILVLSAMVLVMRRRSAQR